MGPVLQNIHKLPTLGKEVLHFPPKRLSHKPEGQPINRAKSIEKKKKKTKINALAGLHLTNQGVSRK